MSDRPIKSYDHLSEDDRQVFQTLDLLKEMARAKRDNPFHQLEKQVCELRHKHMLKNPEPPTKVFVGFKQMEAFHHVPPWMQSTKQAQLGTAELMGMEVIRVIKDDFLMVV